METVLWNEALISAFDQLSDETFNLFQLRNSGACLISLLTLLVINGSKLDDWLCGAGPVLQ